MSNEVNSMSTATAALRTIGVLTLCVASSTGTMSGRSKERPPRADDDQLMLRVKKVRLRARAFKEENIYRVVDALRKEAHETAEGAGIPITLSLEVDEHAVDELARKGHTSFTSGEGIDVCVVVTMFFEEEMSLDQALDALAEYCGLTWRIQERGVVMEARQNTPPPHPRPADPFR